MYETVMSVVIAIPCLYHLTVILLDSHILLHSRIISCIARPTGGPVK